MSTHEVDDRSSEIAYSQPVSGHHWSPIGSTESYDGTLTLTRSRGATARITFQGTRIQVMGLVSPQGTGGAPASTYMLDNRPSIRFTTTQAPSTSPRVLFYDSGELDAGSHTLIVTNDAEGPFFWIDSFIVTENLEPESEPSPDPPPQPAPVTTPPADITAPSSETNQAPVTRANQSGVASSPTPRAGDSSMTLPASSVTQGEVNPSESVLEGGIKIIVTTRDATPSGGLIIILLSILAVITMKRKARRKSLLPDMRTAHAYHSPPSVGTSSQPISFSPSPIPFGSEGGKNRYIAGGLSSYPAHVTGNGQLSGHQPQLSVNSTLVSSATGSSSGEMAIALGEQLPPSYQQAQGQGLAASSPFI
ncbi:hypothetical protein BKA70DRAFT_828230 [Coprinopsis sp. MPI-PUGE-AT-0042]|nr:hypothetical protein BKA70DRAFT_828230 [Coprinopsis sp. MPI-PUGE-AT-0042]